MKALLQLLGSHFVGLWIYEPYGKERKWCVTFRDIHGHYWETDLHDEPEDALHQANAVIEAQRKGVEVEATGQVQRVEP